MFFFTHGLFFQERRFKRTITHHKWSTLYTEIRNVIVIGWDLDALLPVLKTKYLNTRKQCSPRGAELLNTQFTSIVRVFFFFGWKKLKIEILKSRTIQNIPLKKTSPFRKFGVRKYDSEVERLQLIRFIETKNEGLI